MQQTYFNIYLCLISLGRIPEEPKHVIYIYIYIYIYNRITMFFIIIDYMQQTYFNIYVPSNLG